MDEFNHEMLILAREARGFTQSALAMRISVGQGTLSKFETGVAQPQRRTVTALARALGYPEAFFREPGHAYGFPPFHYRRRKKLSAKALGRIIAEMNIRRLHVRKLALSYPPPASTLIPEIDMDEYQGTDSRVPSAEDVARSVREAWMLSSGPVPNMMELIEQNGGIVVPFAFKTALLDAMSQRIDGMPVLFFVNVNSPADRVRYTLAHELGHMCLHTTALKSDEEMEREADAFAGAFLLPADEIKSQLRRFDLRHVANMKAYWKVAMQAIAVRAHRLNLITPYQYKMFWIEMGKLGYRRREPNEPLRETPTLLHRMVAFHRSELGYSVEDMAKLLCLEVPEFTLMYGADAPYEPEVGRNHLRLVK